MTHSAFVYFDSFNDGNDFRPIPQLTIPSKSILTLLFVQPGKIFYTEPSNDPIFPTSKTPDHVPGIDSPYYLYKEGFARPLAAVDTIEWRDLSEGPEWRSWIDPAPQNEKFPGELWFLWFSIRSSFSYQSISRRLGSGLVASSRISGFSSLPLDREQWKTEAVQLFKTSLARAQFEAQNIARGVYANYDGYVKAKYPLAICRRTYIFRTEGWNNINGIGYLVAALPTTLIILAAIPIREFPEALLWEVFCFGKADTLAYHSVVGVWAVFDGLKLVLIQAFQWLSKAACQVGTWGIRRSQMGLAVV